MGFFKSKKNIAFLSIILALIIALAVVCGALFKKSMQYEEINAKLFDNNGSLADISSKIDVYESKIEEYSEKVDEYSSKFKEQENSKNELQSKLEAAEKEKKRLEEENSSIRKQMEQLAAKKQAERLASLLSLGSAIQSGKIPTDKVCYLTFDDGPSDNTLKILEILGRYNNIKATFFVVGTAKLEYLPQIHKAGHTVGLHSNTHRYDIIYKSEAAYLSDLYDISSAVEKRIGIKSAVMRFPGGGSNTNSAEYCKGIMTRLTQRLPELGYSYFDWNVDSGDAAGSNVSAASISRNVLTQAENKNAICVLMHDTSAKKTTVDALPTIIEGLINMGFRFEPLKPESYGFHHSVRN